MLEGVIVVWFSYYRQSVAVYEQIAKRDPDTTVKPCVGRRVSESMRGESRHGSEF
jgi:hypothetical protein